MIAREMMQMPSLLRVKEPETSSNDDTGKVPGEVLMSGCRVHALFCSSRIIASLRIDTVIERLIAKPILAVHVFGHDIGRPWHRLIALTSSNANHGQP